MSYVVLKKSEIDRYATDEQKRHLYDMQVEIMLNRTIQGKRPVNDYVVINRDEPYFSDVMQLVESNEKEFDNHVD
ncbi:hypothetical protein FO510_05290 [Bacillus pumilus]|uniref:hypothetical protein n=1 Tax=Bacillus pumilus TaxID=1408 RepID=UPI00017A5FD3|nr:hypothetical protein [Bacillus pumilus]EDW22421.1 hypothetical protein BAT_0172 [Bacillus pumilus ATCC 7061]MCR4352221.1 hypothetical protein [Bacillus pumilus]MCY7504032.1 hypothetical protein [Bacillus pumilus]MDR4268978.1 hypothetical protein [Bacillus pumilus]MDR4269065.1 hypothetical protein [Bacillus pumilus]